MSTLRHSRLGESDKSVRGEQFKGLPVRLHMNLLIVCPPGLHDLAGYGYIPLTRSASFSFLYEAAQENLLGGSFLGLQHDPSHHMA